MVVGALLRVNVLRRVGCEGRRVTTRPERPQPLPRGGKTAVWIWVAERLHNHSMIGTSLWVPARPGHWLGTREKKRKASRASDVRSQAPEPVRTNVAMSASVDSAASRAGSRGGGHRVRSGDRATELKAGFAYCLRIAEVTGKPVVIGQVASSPA